MACNICGNTKSSPCACRDHAMTTPCSYNNCDRKATTELCEDLQCAECVSYCQDNFCVTNTNGQTFCVNKGERLDFILQKMALFVKDPACWNSNIAHIWADTVTNTTVKLMWSGVPTGTTSINVYYGTAAGAYILATSSPLGGGISEYELTGLNPSTAYKFKVAATTSTATCDSVELFLSTIA
tara:strand:- start:152 stop:700 length:549 start_codon:yes stop_codon:yes gene_type:complete